jgi:hypothetical protein
MADAALLLPEFEANEEDLEEGSQRWMADATERLAAATKDFEARIEAGDAVGALEALKLGDVERLRAGTPSTSGRTPEREPASRASVGTHSPAAGCYPRCACRSEAAAVCPDSTIRLGGTSLVPATRSIPAHPSCAGTLH